jgi:antibiotic biosynthesis monooxygenase (ABM) superfamily enzyme
MPTRSSTPTVIVARRASPGREHEFERWLEGLVDEARRAPGFIGAEIQRPPAHDPLEWIVVYRFETAELLGKWIDSPERRARIDEGDHLADGPAREQTVVLQRDLDPVTAIISVRVDPEHRDEYLELYHEIDDAMSRAPGFIRTEMFEPVPGTQEDHVVVFTFDGREHLDAWLTSPERRAIIERMQPFIQSPHTINVVGGFGGWFDLDDGREPKRWKQACVVLLALYPTVLAITLVDNWIIPDPPLAIDVLIGNIVGVIILTWFLMPPLTTHLSPWLRR